MSGPILSVKNLVTKFQLEEGEVTAVNKASFEVHRGKTLGIVGESGSGKSVTALSIMGLIPSPPGQVTSGEIILDGQNLLELSEREMSKVRGNKISMIFQEPMTSLNPVFTVGAQIQEVIQIHQKLSKKDSLDNAIELLQQVGIPAPERRVREYPHQLSGGMRQRVMIAIALACRPDILIADEPTTALDVTIQAQILELMKKLQETYGMGVIMITHDLGVVAETCDEVAVMYCGSIVEAAPVKTLFDQPLHPYTQGLIQSIPSFDSQTFQAGKERRLKTIHGVVPPLTELPAGCSFADRCHLVFDQCRGVRGRPLLTQVAPHHRVACFHEQRGE